ncbi:MAG: hypothetical protein PUD20_00785, partial [bacterium]|nr:hypothetical protein [bacterium]
MYKDVWKKILCVAISVCMIIGVVEVAPKVKASAEVYDGFYKIQARDKTIGETVNLLVKVKNADLEYNGNEQGPEIDGPVYLLGSGNTKTEIQGVNWALTGFQTDASDGDYLCYLKDENGTKYDVLDGDSNGIPFRIKKATIFSVDYERKNSDVVKWNSDGSVPELTRVYVTLNGGVTRDLNQTQYQVIKASGVGSVSATIKVTDSDNFDLSTDKTASVNFTCGYDLGGSVANGTSKFTMSLQPDSMAYDGSKKTPSVIIRNESGDEYSYTSTSFKTTYYDSKGSQVSEMKESGEYTVSVTPAGGAGAFVENSGDYFTGEYQGHFTIGALQTKNISVSAKNLKTGTNDRIWESGSATKQLVYPYSDGSAVELQDYSFWDQNSQPLDKNLFDISWRGTTSVGVAYMIISPKTGSNYTGTIEIPYFITSELTIESLTFVDYGTYSGDKISIPYRANDIPIVPSAETVKNSSGTKLTRGSAYNVTYAYQKDGVWYPATGAGDLNLAYAGKKKIIVTGLAGYASQPPVEKEYTVAAVDMNDSEFKDKFQLQIVSPGPFYYNGTAWKPSFNFTYNGEKIDAKDYRVNWTNNINSGMATLTVEASGTGNFAGSKSVNFTISPISLSYASVEGPHYKYNREPINPSVIIDGGVGHVYGADFKYQMTEGIDYEIITDSDEVFKG